MRTQSIDTYAEFVAQNRPYLPFVKDDRLIVPNIAVNAHIRGAKAKNRLMIETIVVYNRGALTAVFTTCLSCQGTRQRWLYWLNGKRVYWNDLRFENALGIMRAWLRYMNNSGWPEHIQPPCRKWRAWLQYLDIKPLCDKNESELQ